MVLSCPRCRKINPTQAMFCFNDGTPLGDPSRQPLTDPARQRFHSPFIFPSGQICYSFDELVLGISKQWDEARDLLAQGVFTNFMAGLGRGDLSVAARAAAREPDPDQGLDQFLSRLPAGVLQPPRLTIDPAKVNLGTLRPGQDIRFDLHLHNEGMGLLHGSVSCENSPWLVFGDQGSRSKKKIFQFLHDTTISVQIRGKALVGSQKPLIAQLMVDSNGGVMEVPISFEVPVVPFPEGALAGALTPRQLAEKARDNAKDAADLFARGVVEKWYQANGWTYPVQDPAASGVAAIQQYFEALGVTSAPRVTINATELRLQGRPGETVRSTLTLSTAEKKPVYAHASSDQPWLTVNEIKMDGRSAVIHLRIPFVPDRGAKHAARLTITTNGRQRFVVPVTLDVSGAAPGGSSTRNDVYGLKEPAPAPAPEPQGEQPWFQQAPPYQPVVSNGPVEPEPIAPPPVRRTTKQDLTPAPTPEESPVGGQGNWMALLPILFLCIGLSVTLIHDLLLWGWGPAPGDPFAGMEQVVQIQFHDKEIGVRLSQEGGVKPVGGGAVETIPGFWEPSMRFGLELAKPDRFGKKKRLTYEIQGLTNNTVVKLDDNEWIFGDRPFRDEKGTYMGNWPGKWADRNAKPDRPLRDGHRSIWEYPDQKIFITQTVGLVAGAQSGKIDTCLVRYTLENKDSKPHKVGLRFMLDTFIGGNDGVPFLIPGQNELCKTSHVFNDPQMIPDFIQARETEDLANPGTIAFIQFRIKDTEPPSRVTLSAWPHPVMGAEFQQEKTLWNVPVMPMKTVPPGDSCVVMYWAEKELAPGKKRELAFAYGLGSVAASETGGALGLSVGGSFVPNGQFTVTAEVRQPQQGQKVTLQLPEGFSFIDTPATQDVPVDNQGGIRPVTWKVKAGPKEDKCTLRVESSTGVSQSLPIRIQYDRLFGK